MVKWEQKISEPDLERPTDDFIQRALEQMNTSGSGMIGFVLRYTDATKTTIQNLQKQKLV